LQAHICVVASEADVAEVIRAFQDADGFRSVASWSYACRISGLDTPEGVFEAIEDGLDEGVGEKILGVLRRTALNGLLLVISRWQDYGASSALEMHGTQLYSQVVERCKDLIANLKAAVGMAEGGDAGVAHQPGKRPKPPPGPQNFDFGYLPPLPEPRISTKFGPNHFMSETSLNRPQSLPNLFQGGDVRLWMENDKCLRQLSEGELWALRAMRQPDCRIERVLQAVALLTGKRPQRQASSAVARWGQCREVLRSAAFRTELLLFDANTINAEAALQACQLVDGLAAEDIRRVNVGAAALLEWVRGVARWRIEGPPAEDTSTGLQAVQARQADLSGLGAVSAVQFPGPSKRRSALALNKQVSPLRRHPIQLIAAG
jgi:hypothetical protein